MTEQAEKLIQSGRLSPDSAKSIAHSVSDRLQTLFARDNSEITTEDKDFINLSVSHGARILMQSLDSTRHPALPFDRYAIRKVMTSVRHLVRERDGLAAVESLPYVDEIVEDNSKFSNVLNLVSDGRYAIHSNGDNIGYTIGPLEDLGILFQSGFSALAEQNAGIEVDEHLALHLEELLRAREASAEHGAQPNFN